MITRLESKIVNRSIEFCQEGTFAIYKRGSYHLIRQDTEETAERLKKRYKAKKVEIYTIAGHSPDQDLSEGSFLAHF